MKRTEEEERLLPPRSSDVEEHDPEAVSIPRPDITQTPRSMAMVPRRSLPANRKLFAGPLMPINTLNGVEQGTMSKRSQRGIHGTLRSHGLDLRPNRKRRTFIETEEIEDSETDDELGRPSAISGWDKNLRHGNGRPSHSKRLSQATISIQQGIPVDEYKVVENKVSSDSYVRQGKNAGWSVMQSKTLDESPDVLEVGFTTRPQYRGTARPKGQKISDAKELTITSPYFLGSVAQSPQRETPPHAPGARKPLGPLPIDDSKTFQARTSSFADCSISSDELQYKEVKRGTPPRSSQNTVRRHTELAEPAKEGIISSHDQERVSRHITGLQQSRGNRGGSHTEARSNNDVNTGFGIKTFAFGPYYRESDVMGLVLSADGSTLTLMDDGRESNVIIRLRKIQRIHHSDSPSDRKVRIEAAATAGTRHNVFDMTLFDERYFSKFLRLLENLSNPRMNSKSSYQMEKIFVTRRKHFNAENSQNNAQSRSQFMEPEPGSPKRETERVLDEVLTEGTDAETRSRRKPKLASRLQGKVPKAIHSAPPSAAVERKQERQYTGDLKNNVFRGPKEQHQSGQIDEIVGELFKDRNHYLTRSSRSKVVDPAALEEVLRKERFSVKHGLGPPWKHPLVYPPTGKKKTTVEYSDLPRLDEGEFLNDNLVEFYLRYLAERLNEQDPELAKTIYWFNTYLFTSLTQGKQGKRINYDSVKKWTRNVDIFSYDYVIVPINESTHWYIVIICNLPNLMKTIREGDDCEPPTTPLTQDVNVPSELEIENTENKIQQDPIASGPIHEVANTQQPESLNDMKMSDVVKGSDPDSEMLLEEHEHLSRLSIDDQKTEIPDSGTNTGVDEVSTVPDGKIDQSPLSAGRSPTQRRGKRKSNLPASRTYNASTPAIITLDSLGLSHGPTIRVLKDYLMEEAKNKLDITLEDGGLKGMNAKGIPHQTNYCDCGLYLLGYMDKFTESPKNFISKLLQREFDEVNDWPKLLPNQMRANIRDCIQELHKIQDNAKKDDAKQQKALPRVSDVPKRSTPPEANQSGNILDDLTKRLAQDTQKPGAGTAGVETAGLGTAGIDKSGQAYTRADALKSALALDEPDHRPAGDSEITEERARDEDSIVLSKPTLADEPSLIVLDSQESTVPLRSIEIPRPDDAVSAAVFEVPESPKTPSRPKTRGKPEPDYTMEEHPSRKRVKVKGEMIGLDVRGPTQAICVD